MTTPVTKQILDYLKKRKVTKTSKQKSLEKLQDQLTQAKHEGDKNKCIVLEKMIKRIKKLKVS